MRSPKWTRGVPVPLLKKFALILWGKDSIQYLKELATYFGNNRVLWTADKSSILIYDQDPDPVDWMGIDSGIRIPRAHVLIRGLEGPEKIRLLLGLQSKLQQIGSDKRPGLWVSIASPDLELIHTIGRIGLKKRADYRSFSLFGPEGYGDIIPGLGSLEMN